MEYTIERKRSAKKLVSDLIAHRHLFWVFAWRDLKLKYRQTVIGFLWVVLQPLIMMGIFTVVFASRIDTASTEIPYPVYVFASLIVYNIFAGSMSAASTSLVNHGHIIKKTYFPRIILPASTLFIALVDFSVSLVILLVLMYFTGTDIHLFHFLFYSVISFLVVALPTLGFGILFSGLNVRYRDINFIYPFFLQVMLFISPIIYPIQSATNDFFKYILMLNPITSAIEFQKVAVQPNYNADAEAVLFSIGSSVVVFVLGLITFTKAEESFADII